MPKEKYARLSETEKATIKKLTKEGKSLNKISKILEVGKTTVYYQVRKFKPKQQKEFFVNLPDFQIGELIGAFAGDGSHTYCLNNRKDNKKGGQHRIRYHLSLKTDFQYAKYLIDLLKHLNLNPHLFIREDNNTVAVAVSSIDYLRFIGEYLEWDKDKTFSVRLKNEINSYNVDFLKGFARGLMDTDGFLNSGNATCACISKKLIDNLSSIFTKFNIKTSRTSIIGKGNRRELFYVRVLKGGLKDYNKFIGFSNSYKQDKLDNILKRDGDARI